MNRDASKDQMNTCYTVEFQGFNALCTWNMRPPSSRDGLKYPPIFDALHYLRLKKS